MGLHAVTDSSDLVAWTTTLADGAPLRGVTVSCGDATTASGADGVSRLPVARKAIIATVGMDSTFMPDDELNRWGSSPARARFFTFDDRGMYKPGEEVNVKGWVRSVSDSKTGDVSLQPGAAGKSVHWIAKDSRNAEIGTGDASVSALGGFSFAVKTPANANLGRASVTLALAPQDTGWHSFDIQEFRRPEFEVHASTSEGPHFVGEHAVASVDAKYYAGGGLSDAEVTWTVSRTDGAFRPPNRDDYRFGDADWTRAIPRRDGKPERRSETWTGRTDAQGTHRMRLDFDALDTPYSMSLSLAARVMDVNRQQWAAYETLLVHPASVYVGLKFDKRFLRADESIPIDTLVVDLDGKAVAGRAVEVNVARVDWEQTVHGFEEREVDEQRCDVTSTAEPVRCNLSAKKGGQYRLKAVAIDEFGRKSQTVTRVWVMDPDAPLDRSLGADAVQVIADKTAYAGGDTAELLVIAPFAPAHGMLVLARGGILRTERFEMSEATQTLKVPIDGALTPNVNATVILAGSAARDEGGVSAPRRPAFARGNASLAIPPQGANARRAREPARQDARARGPHDRGRRREGRPRLARRRRGRRCRDGGRGDPRSLGL
jgi:uncharacterized protein YfaS (alpha-2-macroglobulin family)